MMRPSMWEDIAWNVCCCRESASDGFRLKELKIQNDLRKKELETVSTWMCTQLHDLASSIGYNEVLSRDNEQLRATRMEQWSSLPLDSRKAYDPIMAETVLTGTKHHLNAEDETFLEEIKSLHAQFLSLALMNNCDVRVQWNEGDLPQVAEVVQRNVEDTCASMSTEDTKRVHGAKAQLQGVCEQVKQVQAEYELMASRMAEESNDLQSLAANSFYLFVELMELFNEGGQEEAPQEMMKLFAELRDVAYNLQVSKLQAPDATPEADNFSQALSEAVPTRMHLQFRDLVNDLRASPLSQPLLEHSQGTVLQRLELQENEVERVRMHLCSMEELFTSKGDIEECQNQLNVEDASPAEAELLKELKAENQQRKHMIQKLTAQMMRLIAQVEQDCCDISSASKNIASGMTTICNEVKFWSSIEDDDADDEILLQTEGGNRFGDEQGEEASAENIAESHEGVNEFLGKPSSVMQKVRSQKATDPRMEINDVTGSLCCEKDSDASSTCPGDDRLPPSTFSSDGRNSSTQ